MDSTDNLPQRTDKEVISRIRPKRSHWPREVFDAAQLLYNSKPTPTPAQLTDLLSRKQSELGFTPGESAIRQWIEKGWIALDPEDGPWSLAESSGASAALVLPVLRWASEHDRPRPTRALARWIVRIRRIAPTLDLESVYDLAQAARRGGGDVERVEQYLSYEPWTDDGSALAAAHEAGRLDFGVVFMSGGVEPRRKDGHDG